MAALTVAFTMASCNKEQLIESGDNINGGDCIITAYTEDNITKTSLSGDDSKGYDVVWSKGDKIKIGNNIFELTEGEGTTKGTFRGTIPEDGTYTACYPETYNGRNWPVNLTYTEDNITGSPMKADVTISGGKVTGPLSFKNAGGILRLTLKGNATVRDITFFGTNENINMTCGAGVQLNDTDGKVFRIAVPAGEFSEAGFEFYFNDGNSIKKRMKSGIALVIERCKITEASISGINATGPIGMLPGVFSVAADRQVRFSKGNLRYSVDSGTWSFFDRQYNCGPSDYEDGHDKEISLFTWGYNSTKSIIPDGTDGDNVSRTSGDLEQSEDWGSQIGDGYTWRTLTNAEWQYLLKNRTDANRKYSVATVCGMHGLIILPDIFIDPMKNGGSGAFVTHISRWTSNVYTGGDWEAMEYAGAVFLPDAGLRDGMGIWNAGGHYWSSSVYPEPLYANIIYFNESNTFNLDHYRRGCGCSVRLVTSTNATYTYTVSFDSNGKTASGMPASIKEIAYGAAIAKPSSIPTAGGYIFTGWFKDRNCTTLWDFDSDVVTKHTTLYAGWAEEPISGKFTVNSTGKQVYFSKGNLWTDGSNVLHFEDKQYGFNDKYESSHVSHFTWNISAAGAAGVYGSTGALFCDEAHKVSVGISGPLYYALSKDEWKYLFTGREDSESGYTVDITYGGVKGILIYPDNYNQWRLEPGTVIETDADFPKGGCVFLPAAGWRSDKEVKHGGSMSNGFYRTSSATGNFKPYSLNFFCGTPDIEEISDESNIILLNDPAHGAVYISEAGSKHDALAIRLVATVN